MGWSSGSDLMSKIITILDNVACPGLEEVYQELIPAFEDQDCDTLHECLGKNSNFDRAYQMLYPDHYAHLYSEYDPVLDLDTDDDLMYENLDQNN